MGTTLTSMRAIFDYAAMSRGVPILASALIHVGAGTMLVSGGAGHASANTLEIVPVDMIPLESAESDEPAPPVVPDRDPPNAERPAPAHTHPYPVPSHEAHPHDPSMPHAQVKGTAGEAAPAVTSEAPVVPRFTIAVGGVSTPSRSAAARSGSADGDGRSGASESAVVAESAVSVPAKLLSSVPPRYPPDARANEIEADVPLEIVVDTAGNVADARVLQRAGSGFDEAALEAIRRYHFSPAQQSGRSIRVRIRWSVQFRLR